MKETEPHALDSRVRHLPNLHHDHHPTSHHRCCHGHRLSNHMLNMEDTVQMKRRSIRCVIFKIILLPFFQIAIFSKIQLKF